MAHYIVFRFEGIKRRRGGRNQSEAYYESEDGGKGIHLSTGKQNAEDE